MRVPLGFLDHIELWLSAAGLVVIAAVPALVPTDGTPWRAVAVTAVAVGLLHGVIFWVVRRRQRRVRQEAIAEVRSMVQDLVNNQLQVLVSLAAAPETHTTARSHATRLQEVGERISRQLAGISEESLVRWQTMFPAAAGTPPTEDPPLVPPRRPSPPAQGDTP